MLNGDEARAALFEQFGPLLAGPPRPVPEHAPLQVISMVCRSNLLFFLFAVKSLIRFSELEFSLWVISDGSLSASDVGILRSELPGVHVRRPSGSRLTGRARRHPRLARFCAEHVFGVRMAEIFACVESPRLILLDSDVLFLRRPVEIVAWARAAGERSVYNRDTVRFPCDAMKREEFSATLGVRPPEYFNAGLLCMPASVLDMARCDETLAYLYAVEGHPTWVWEQAVWAVLVAGGVHEPLPGSYHFVNDENLDEERPLGQLTSVHYSGPSRELFLREGVAHLVSRGLL